MKIKACIFDLDGVIVDTAKYHYQSWKKVAEGLGIPFSPLDNEYLKGISRMASLDYILELGGVRLDPSLKRSLADEKNSGYLDYIRSISGEELLPGVKGLLEQLSAAGIPIGLGSSSRNALLILEQVGLSGYFGAVVDGTSRLPSKPDPAIFLEVASLLRVFPGDGVVLEDSRAGIQAAKAGGFRSVGLGDPEILSGADIILESLEGLTLPILEFMLD